VHNSGSIHSTRAIGIGSRGGQSSVGLSVGVLAPLSGVRVPTAPMSTAPMSTAPMRPPPSTEGYVHQGQSIGLDVAGMSTAGAAGGWPHNPQPHSPRSPKPSQSVYTSAAGTAGPSSGTGPMGVAAATGMALPPTPILQPQHQQTQARQVGARGTSGR
jgi:hypothetical protein